AVRVIPCLDVDAGRVVKGVNFLRLRDAGDPVELAAAYDAQGADELVFLDITASAERRHTMVDVVAVDARRVPGGGFEVTTHGGRRGTGLDAVGWASRAAELGAGEVLLNSMDADGTRAGFDLELIRAVRAAVSVPVIASGGAGQVADFPPAVAAGADAVLAASVV